MSTNSREIQQARRFICGNCKFYMTKGPGLGECRVRSPAAFAHPIPVPTGPEPGAPIQLQWATAAAWPQVPADAWCGEHAPALVM